MYRFILVFLLVCLTFRQGRGIPRPDDDDPRSVYSSSSVETLSTPPSPDARPFTVPPYFAPFAPPPPLFPSVLRDETLSHVSTPSPPALSPISLPNNCWRPTPLPKPIAPPAPCNQSLNLEILAWLASQTTQAPCSTNPSRTLPKKAKPKVLFKKGERREILEKLPDSITCEELMQTLKAIAQSKGVDLTEQALRIRATAIRSDSKKIKNRSRNFFVQKLELESQASSF